MSRWEFLHYWYMPFLWIAVSSLIAVPVAVYFQNGMQLHEGSELGLAYGSHWVVRAPAGRTVEWDAEIVDEVVNERLQTGLMNLGAAFSLTAPMIVANDS